jgi:hypothetical protein
MMHCDVEPGVVRQSDAMRQMMPSREAGMQAHCRRRYYRRNGSPLELSSPPQSPLVGHAPHYRN